MSDKILTEAFDKLKAIEESEDPFCIGETGDKEFTETYTTVEEGRVFNNTGEMLRSMITDIKRVITDVEDGMSDVTDVQDDLTDIIQYYMDAEIKQQRY